MRLVPDCTIAAFVVRLCVLANHVCEQSDGGLTFDAHQFYGVWGVCCIETFLTSVSLSTTPRSLERVDVTVSPLTRVGSLSQVVLAVHDFVMPLCHVAA